MDENVSRVNLNAIKEMVLDEQRLVTYVSLSKELCIHVNHSKSLLHELVEDIKKKQPDTKINVCYIISGLTGDNNARTTVCSETDIDTVKATLKTLFFNHIYSVSKGTPSVDNVALLAVNKFEDLPLCTGLLKNPACVKRTSDEIGKLKSTSQESVQTDHKVVPQKKVKEESKPVQNGHDNGDSVVKLQVAKSEPVVKNEKTSPKKEPLSSAKAADSRKNGQKTQKGIAGFFSKCNSDPGKKTAKEETKVKPEEEEMKQQEKDEVNTVETSKQTKIKPEKMEVDEEVDVVKLEPASKAQSGKAKPKNKTISQIKKNAKVDKKRKRVLQVSDSDSDDEKDPCIDDPPEPENHESEDEIPPTPQVHTVKITSAMINPKKRRKIVDKTYTDEDGYILTKKEEVYESCSDNEVEVKENVQNIPVKTEVKIEISPKSKKNGPKVSKKKVSPPQKGKQATMMSFFKKV